ncbi:hypothetical protein CMI47_16750 [Candidatus Pacearchaeota archaeon]|nr:hypothetical protein [Candidatus Pacearchaeota archaeon]|tara:strand:+ start:380 stop:1174 length:795 start_codon:yes stop_codon:yes gene_type:complete
MVDLYFKPEEAEAYGFSENAGGFSRENERRFFLTKDRIRADISVLEEGMEDANGDAQSISNRIEQLRRREVRIRNYFLKSNMRLVRALSARFSEKFPSVDIRDIFSSGQEKLLESWDKFDIVEHNDIKFSTYYGRSLYNAVYRLSQRRDLISLDDEVTEDGLSRHEFIKDPYFEDPSSQVSDKDTGYWIERHLGSLNSRESYIIRRRYGLYRRKGGCREKVSTLENVGKIVKLTKERVRQVELRALEKIRGRAEVEGSNEGFIS